MDSYTQQVEHETYRDIHLHTYPFKQVQQKVSLQKKKKNVQPFFGGKKISQGSRRQTALLHNGFHRQLQNATLWGDDDPLFLGHLQRDESPINRWATFKKKTNGWFTWKWVPLGILEIPNLETPSFSCCLLLNFRGVLDIPWNTGCLIRILRMEYYHHHIIG